MGRVGRERRGDCPRLVVTRPGWKVTGFVSYMLELVGYYVTAHLRGFAAGSAILAFWALCALVGGPLFRLAGQLWRTACGRLRGLGGTALPAAFLAESWPYHPVLHYESTAVLWLSVAIVLLLFSRRAVELRWLAVTLPFGLLAEIALGIAYRQRF